MAECDAVSYWHARQELTDRLRSEPFGAHSRFLEHTAGVFQNGLRHQPGATDLEHVSRPPSEQGFSDLTAVGVRGIEKEHPRLLLHRGEIVARWTRVKKLPHRSATGTQITPDP
jgi:hypothetical protein